MSNFASVNEQNTYYNNASKFSYDCVFNKIGDPLLISEEMAKLLDFTYGRVRYQNIWYYFQVLEYKPNAQNQTTIYYEIDWWETYRYQIGIGLGTGQITRKATKPTVELRPSYLPDSWATIDITLRSIEDPTAQPDPLLNGGYNPCVLAYARDNTTDFGCYICLDIVENQRNAFLVNIGGLVKFIVDVLPDISENMSLIGAWYSSFAPPLQGPLSRWINTNKNGVYYIKATDKNADIQSTLRANCYANDTNLANSVTERYVICDERGNPVYELPDSVKCEGSFSMFLNMTMSSAQWLCSMRLSNIGRNDEIGYASFTIDCEPLDFYNDSWTQYQSTQRQMDIDMRSLERTNSAVSQVLGSGESAIGGAVSGALGGVGGGIGAIAGLGINLAGAGINYAYQSKYSHPKQQAIIDNNYKRAPDILSLSGNGVVGSLWMWLGGSGAIRKEETYGAGFKIWKPDNRFTTKYENDVSNYGYYTDIETDAVDDYIANGPFQANCEVNGLPYNYAGQIQERLRNGVWFS